MNAQDLINEGIELFNNKKFDEAIEKLNQALDEIENKNSKIQEQNNAQYLLGRCYLEQAMKAKGKESEQLFEHAVEHFQQSLEFAKQLEDKQKSIQQQIYAQYLLGRCYFDQAVKIKDEDSSKVKELTEKAFEYFLFSFNNLSQLKDKLERNRADKIIRQYLREICFLQEEWQSYFDQKKQSIREKLFQNKKDKLNRCYLHHSGSFKYPTYGIRVNSSCPLHFAFSM